MNKFTQSIKFVIEREGGYSNDPVDKGGETNYGISKRAHPEVDIKNLTPEGAMDIYHKHYWVAYNIEQYDLPYCVAVLDSYVQHSPSKVKGMLEVAGGNLQSLLQARREYYLKLISFKPELVRFKKGWLNRVNELSKYASILMSG